MNWRTIVLFPVFPLSPRSLKNWFFFSSLATSLTTFFTTAFSLPTDPDTVPKLHFKNRQWSSPRPWWWKCFSTCSFGLFSSLWHDRHDRHTTSPTSSWFRNTRHGPRLVFILPYKPNSVCQHPLLHIRASSYLFRCSNRDQSLDLSSSFSKQLLFLLKLKITPSFITHTLSTQLQKSAPPHQIPNLFLSMQRCIDDTKSWMTLNKLKLNDDKQWSYPRVENPDLSLFPSQTL